MEKDVYPVWRSCVRLNMDRFFNDDENNPEFKFEDDQFGSEFDDEIEFIDRQDLIEMMHLELAQDEFNKEILSRAIEIASKNISWYFRGPEYKMNQIELIYNNLLKITDIKAEGE